MICQGFPSESYDLFAFGVLDEAEAEDIRDHVRLGCDQCHQSLQTSLARVSEMSLVVPMVEPPKALRKRVLASVKPAPSGWRAWIWSPSFAIVAASVGLAVGLGAAWSLGLTQHTGKIVAELKTPPTSVSQQTEPGKAVATDVGVTAPILRNRDDLRQLEAARRELLETQNIASIANRELDQERQTAATLENNLRVRDQQLAAARRDLDAAEARTTVASKDEEATETLRKQLVASQTRVDELMGQVATSQAALQRQETQTASNADLATLVTSPSLRVVDLRPTEQGGNSNARALVTQNGKAILFASQLPPLAAGRVYQLWLMRAQAPAIVSGGLFRPGTNHEATLEIGNAQMLSGLTGLAITDEPQGGSPLPTGHKILIGVARS